MEGLEPYKLFDVDTGKVFVAYVSSKESQLLDIDQNRRFRLLNDIKATQQPTDTWDVSYLCSSASAAPSSTSKNGPKCRNGVGAKWNKKATEDLLNACLRYRKWLRLKSTPISTWNSLTVDVNAKIGHTYKWEQVQEKMRNMKSTYNKAKQGQHGGDKWPSYWLMNYIYDDPIVEGDVTFAPEGLHFLSTSIVEDPVASSTLVASPRTSELSDHAVASHVNDSDGEGEAHAIEVNNNEVFKADENQHNETFDVEGHQHNDDDEENPFRDLTNQKAPEVISDVIKSPSKKKSKKLLKNSGPSVIANILKSPLKNSPRKRKVPKMHLNWNADWTEAFVSECIVHKESLQKNDIPANVWKLISDAMEEKHNVTVGWNYCRDKFAQMMEFFLSSLPAEGCILGSKWPFYEKFCILFDIPNEYHSLVILSAEDGDQDEEEEHEEVDPAKATKLWPDLAVELLLDLYKLKEPSFDSSKSFLKHTLLFSEISQQMGDFGVKVSAKQAQSKLDRLKGKFREEFDGANKTGASPSKWPLYEKMLEIFRGCPTLNAPYTASVARGLKYCKKGVEQASRDGTRSRPSSNEKKPKEKKFEKKAIFKTWQQGVQEKKVENQEKMNEELRLLRIAIETAGKDRKEYMNKLLEKI